MKRERESNVVTMVRFWSVFGDIANKTQYLPILYNYWRITQIIPKHVAEKTTKLSTNIHRLVHNIFHLSLLCDP